jgi:hypothetical protein
MFATSAGWSSKPFVLRVSGAKIRITIACRSNLQGSSGEVTEDELL